MLQWMRSFGSRGRKVSRGMIRGISDAGDSLRVLGSVLGSSTGPSQRRWLIDNRSREPVPLGELARFVCLAERHEHSCDRVSIAWVANAPWTPYRQALVDQLPFEFRHFENVEQAEYWLRGQ